MQSVKMANVTLVKLAYGNASIEKPHGVYMWPNGWLTVHPTSNTHEGRFLPPHMVEEVYFSAEADDS